MNMPLESIIIYSLASICVLLVLWIIRLEWRLKKLLGGRDARSLINAVQAIHRELADTNTFKKDVAKVIENMERRLRKTVRGVETVRFNPFQGTGSGGNQSFATAFIDEDGDGVVISSLYSRDRTSVFSKPVKRHVSEFELSDEERQVLKEAKRRINE